MNHKEKLPKLMNVYRPSNPLSRRQLPLFVDENLTLVMDVRNSGIVCDNPLIRGKELEEFTRKWSILSKQELNSALQITKSELMNVLNQNVPCVGCRRSVEKLHEHLFKFGHPTLDPLMVKPDGTITIKDEKQAIPQVLCSIFHNHSIRLAKLIENQPKRNKKSLRCLLHSLDSQRSRPLTPIWRDVWDSMKLDCKKDVCIIEAPSLHATLETYLRKHRFCGECRTKVLKAYSLLIDEPEPCKEKGYVSSLYAGINRCLQDKHIHLQTQTDYITKLISRAEPELLGSRRERHAKTLEIAQEEVLTCLGICMYERLHRIYMRMREEECTCQVFAAVAVDTLSRSFETAVERKQGVSQLELLYAELAREEQQKQIRKEQKKIKRKRKKAKLPLQNCKENCTNNNDYEDEFNSGDDGKEDEDDDDEDEHYEQENKNDKLSCYNCKELSSSPLKNNLVDDLNNEYVCSNLVKVNNKKELRCNSTSGTNDLWLNDCKFENENKCNNNYSPTNNNFKKETNGSLTSEHSHDCGYSSENNNGFCETGSFISSSPEGSELAFSDSSFCRDNDKFLYGNQPTLEEMLGPSDDDDDNSESKLTPEELWEFKNNYTQIYEKRQQLRETLKRKFKDFCNYGRALEVPRYIIQTKYASN